MPLVPISKARTESVTETGCVLQQKVEKTVSFFLTGRIGGKGSVSPIKLRLKLLREKERGERDVDAGDIMKMFTAMAVQNSGVYKNDRRFIAIIHHFFLRFRVNEGYETKCNIATNI